MVRVRSWWLAILVSVGVSIAWITLDEEPSDLGSRVPQAGDDPSLSVSDQDIAHGPAIDPPQAVTTSRVEWTDEAIADFMAPITAVPIWAGWSRTQDLWIQVYEGGDLAAFVDSLAPAVAAGDPPAIQVTHLVIGACSLLGEQFGAGSVAEMERRIYSGEVDSTDPSGTANDLMLIDRCGHLYERGIELPGPEAWESVAAAAGHPYYQITRWTSLRKTEPARAALIVQNALIDYYPMMNVQLGLLTVPAAIGEYDRETHFEMWQTEHLAWYLVGCASTDACAPVGFNSRDRSSSCGELSCALPNADPERLERARDRAIVLSRALAIRDWTALNVDVESFRYRWAEDRSPAAGPDD